MGEGVHWLLWVHWGSKQTGINPTELDVSTASAHVAFSPQTQTNKTSTTQGVMLTFPLVKAKK